jgi:hypothetical protein
MIPENYFDVIFLDGGQHAGEEYGNFGNLRRVLKKNGYNTTYSSNCE